MRTIGEALSSLRAQTYKNMSVLIVDNASADGTIDFVRKEFPEFHTLRNFKNLGFARAHNQAIEFSEHAAVRGGKAETAVLVMNPDIVLEPNCISELVAALARHADAGSVGGKLLRIKKEENFESGFRDSIKTNVIDSAGLKIFKNRRVADRGAGEADRGQYDKEEEVFGISGALALYRLSALHAVSGRRGFFDNNFFAYKEDVDLAWRLRRLGWSAWHAPSAVAYHYRGTYGSEARRFARALEERKAISPFVRELSARNHLLTLWKNDSFFNVLMHLPHITAYEAGKMAYYLLREPKTFFASLGALREVPGILRDRIYFRGKVRAKAGEIRKWFA